MSVSLPLSAPSPPLSAPPPHPHTHTGNAVRPTGRNLKPCQGYLVSKETYYSVKRDLLTYTRTNRKIWMYVHAYICTRTHACTCVHKSHPHKMTSLVISGPAPLLVQLAVDQHSLFATVSKETYYSVKRDLLTYTRTALALCYMSLLHVLCVCKWVGLFWHYSRSLGSWPALALCYCKWVGLFWHYSRSLLTSTRSLLHVFTACLVRV